MKLEFKLASVTSIETDATSSRDRFYARRREESPRRDGIDSMAEYRSKVFCVKSKPDSITDSIGRSQQ